MTINTFFLRVAARCNLDCDYCYVFKHRDMSWKARPHIMSTDIVLQFARHLRAYADKYSLKKVNIIFHGGEPLICGEEKILDFVNLIDTTLGENIQTNYSLQTNGTLITESFLYACEKKNIGISLSIDGHKHIHDTHRKYKNGQGSHKDVVKGISLLKQYPKIFEGIIGVIDPNFDPEDIFQFFDELEIENVDLLLPDSTYIDLPKDREQNPNIYKQWLIRAFDTWFFKHQSIHMRTFEHILFSIMGQNSKGALDAFGLGQLDYLTIETDGSYHTSDILKVAYENASSIGFGVNEENIDVALSNKKVIQYNNLLKPDALPEKCKVCLYGNICGGGALPHRYDEKTGFNNPSIYCEEIYALIHHAVRTVQKAIMDEIQHG